MVNLLLGRASGWGFPRCRSGEGAGSAGAASWRSTQGEDAVLPWAMVLSAGAVWTSPGDVGERRSSRHGTMQISDLFWEEKH